MAGRPRYDTTGEGVCDQLSSSAAESVVSNIHGSVNHPQ